MESINPIEKLSLLEKKIFSFAELLKAQKELNARLQSENNELIAKIEKLENTVLKGTQNFEELSQERLLTKMVVDELINSIDKLAGQEPRG